LSTISLVTVKGNATFKDISFSNILESGFINLYKFSFGYENNKKLKEDYKYIDIYLPHGISFNYIINKKYYYKISLIQNNVTNIIKDIQLYNDEPTFRCIITEIVDIIKNI
jgi:hypothetical protein